METRKSNRWSLEGAVSRGRCGYAACQNGVLSLIAIITSLRWRFEVQVDSLCAADEEHESAETELQIWRERTAMLARNIEEAGEEKRRMSWGERRRRRRAIGTFRLRSVHQARISKITHDGAFVRINDLEWPVYIPEVAWGDVHDVSEVVAVGQLVTVKTLSNGTFSKHPFLLLLTA